MIKQFNYISERLSYYRRKKYIEEIYSCRNSFLQILTVTFKWFFRTIKFRCISKAYLSFKEIHCCNHQIKKISILSFSLIATVSKCCRRAIRDKNTSFLRSLKRIFYYIFSCNNPWLMMSFCVNLKAPFTLPWSSYF